MSHSSVPSLFPGFLIVGFICLAIVNMVWREKRGSELVYGWARENGYRLMRADRCLFSKGPFFWGTSKSQIVFRVVVQDTDGMQRSGWVRCGSWLGGLLSNKTEARWD
ncbi:hypothetical protein [Haloferula sp. BvORR071]|uniref:hypothetical protein n=1 Tax=Haloferula sp. BvORR071 TaxID=1396141 RepID=UPI00069775F7|nr:hypothetical protein [Haloferula sp. BvORR071]